MHCSKTGLKRCPVERKCAVHRAAVMLVLTRKCGQRIIIGHAIVIEIVSVNGQYVKVSVMAPEDIPVDREEVYLKKNENVPHTSNPDIHPHRD